MLGSVTRDMENSRQKVEEQSWANFTHPASCDRFPYICWKAALTATACLQCLLLPC